MEIKISFRGVKKLTIVQYANLKFLETELLSFIMNNLKLIKIKRRKSLKELISRLLTKKE